MQWKGYYFLPAYLSSNCVTVIAIFGSVNDNQTFEKKINFCEGKSTGFYGTLPSLRDLGVKGGDGGD